MSNSNSDFFVIYNRALSPMAETDDTNLALQFTECLVEFLEHDCGHKGRYGDRDSIPGSNIFNELRKNIKETRKTFLVVTPGFMPNCWATYCAQSAFKTLLDTKKSDKLIPIGLNITNEMQLDALNITEWIHFPCDWQDATSQKKWNIIKRALTYDGPLRSEPTYQEYIHVQEHGDNKLRSANQGLVAQPTSLQGGEFLNEKFLLRLAENFPGDWKSLAIYLGLNDNTVTKHEVDNAKVTDRAYNALTCWQRSHPGPEGKKVEFLLSVLEELGKKTVAETVQTEYKNYLEKVGSSPSPTAGGDAVEADVGMFRRSTGNTGGVQDQHQMDLLQLARQSEDYHTGSHLLHTSNVTRELRNVTASIEAEPKTNPDAAPISSNSVQLQQGPPMSLPPAPILKLPSLGVRNRSEPDMEIDQFTSNDSVDGIDRDSSDVEQFAGGSAGPDAMEDLPVVTENIVSSAAQNQFMERNVHDDVLDVQTGSHNASDDVRSTRTSLHGEISYQNQPSLSNDDDLTAHVNGTYSRQSATDSSKYAIDSSKSNTDYSKSDTDYSKSDTDYSKSNTDSSKYAIDSNKSNTDYSKSNTDYSKSSTDSSKSSTDSSKSSTDYSKSNTDYSKSSTDSSKSNTDSSKSATDSSKSITDYRQSVTVSRDSVTSGSEKPRHLDIHQREQCVPKLNAALNAADVTPDSGYSCSDAETPVSDQIIPHESQLYQSVCTPVMSGNTDEESKSKGMNTVCQGEADRSSTNQTQNGENRTQNGNQIDANNTKNGANINQIVENKTHNGGNGNQFGENKIQSGENNAQTGEDRKQIGESRIQNGENNAQNGANMDQFGINKIQNGAERSHIGDESSVASNSKMNNSIAQHVSVDDHDSDSGNSGRQSEDTGVTRGTSDTSVPAQRGEERSVVSLVVGFVFSFWDRPEFAYI